MSAKRICAWCGLVIAEGSEPATHGICPRCEEKMRKEEELLSTDEGKDAA